MHRPRLRTLIALCALLPALALAAPGIRHRGQLTIRYNALPAQALPAQSLRSLGVTDAAHTGLLNILVTRTDKGAQTSIGADVKARAMTDTGTPVPVHIREMRDANGISYLGVYRLDHTATLRFDLDITPRGAATQHIHFKHTFVVD